MRHLAVLVVGLVWSLTVSTPTSWAVFIDYSSTTPLAESLAVATSTIVNGTVSSNRDNPFIGTASVAVGETLPGGRISADVSSSVGLGSSPQIVSATLSVEDSSSGSGFYDSSVWFGSGFQAQVGGEDIGSFATWTLDVRPTDGDVVGTPQLITIDVALDGILSATGIGAATASWLVAAGDTPIVNGSSRVTVPGSQAFTDSGTHSFLVPIGSAFDLMFLYTGQVNGSGLAESRAEFLSTAISIHPASVPSVPEPSTLLLLGSGLAGLGGMVWRRHRCG